MVVCDAATVIDAILYTASTQLVHALSLPPALLSPSSCIGAVLHGIGLCVCRQLVSCQLVDDIALIALQAARQPGTVSAPQWSPGHASSISHLVHLIVPASFLVHTAFTMFQRTALVFVLLKAASCAQPEAQEPIAAPLRELPWAQLNFLHTTDVHGWWGGHLQE